MNQPNGFTLIELLLVLTLITILSVISFTSLTTLWHTSQAEVLSSKLFNVLHFARSEAIAHQEPVFLLPINQHWEKGFILKTASQILRTFPATMAQGQLHWRSFPLNRQYLEFLPDGLLYAQNGTFWFCLKNATKPAWSITINKSGRAKMHDTQVEELKCI